VSHARGKSRRPRVAFNFDPKRKKLDSALDFDADLFAVSSAVIALFIAQ